jgi:putative tryptophan/tyrosine transport system substrate-binding protein
MQRREFIATIGAAAATLSLCRSAGAQQKLKIGFLNSGIAAQAAQFLKFFSDSLRSAGYVEGRNVLIEARWGGGQYDRLPLLARELLEEHVSVIVATGGVVSARAAIAATSAVPIVFLIGADPQELGLVAKINQPNGNATGATLFSTELAEKRAQIFFEALEAKPGSITFAHIVNPGAATTNGEITATENAAPKISPRLRITAIEAKTDSEIEAALSSAAKENMTGLLFSADPFFNARRKLVVQLAAQYGIPAMYPFREFVDAGGLMSYGPELKWGYNVVGEYVGRILKGERPGVMPIRAPDTFNLVVNLKAAKGLGLVVNPQIMARADEVIE